MFVRSCFLVVLFTACMSTAPSQPNFHELAQPYVLSVQRAPSGSVIFQDPSFAGRYDFRLPQLTVRGITEFTDRPDNDTRTFSGRLEDRPGRFTLVFYKGVPSLNLHFDDRMIEVRSGPYGALTVTEIDLSGIPAECLTASQHASTERPQWLTVSLQSGAGASECGRPDSAGAMETIDALVVYTPRARQAAGGASAMRESIQINVNETNETFARSDIRARLRLALTPASPQTALPLPPRNVRVVTPPPGLPCVVELDYMEQGPNADLQNLIGVSDPYLREVHALRDYCKADVVTLIVHDPSGGSIAWPPMTSMTSSAADYAFTVVAKVAASGNYLFTHELGHILGAGHNLGKGFGMCPFSHGWHFMDSTTCLKSMMASRTSDRGLSCVKTLNFSDPNVLYGDSGQPTGHPTRANNARTIRLTKHFVSNFR